LDPFTMNSGDILKNLTSADTYRKRELGGPILIAQAAGGSAQKGLNYYLWFMAILSINLGVLNLLPLPVLDGGHLVLLGIEAIRRRRPSVKFVMAFQGVGIAILFMFFIFVMASDLLRLSGG
jgi:regulator of sigma E protease